MKLSYLCSNWLNRFVCGMGRVWLLPDAPPSSATAVLANGAGDGLTGSKHPDLRRQACGGQPE